MNTNILDYIKHSILYLDGGMGTLLQERGLAAGESPELWSITHPEVITEIHKSYFDAGSNVVNANTFGANPLAFDEDTLDAVIRASIENAKRAADQSTGTQKKWVALDIGPSGRMLKPYGDLDFEEAVGLFAATVRLGVRYGADLIVIETMNSSLETKAALLAAKENSSLPVFVTNAYCEDGKLLTGADARATVALLEGMGADAIGLNCSFGPRALSEVAREYLAHASVPVIFKPNAGLPHTKDGRTVFDVPPDEFSREVAGMVTEGVRIVGGCCGTTPEYIRALVEQTAHLTPVPVTEKRVTVVSSYTHAVEFGQGAVLIGERINPTGKKRFKEALRSQDIDYILKEGLDQQASGAHILDVNVGLPGIDEPKMLRRAVTELQAVTDLPLQIDTSDPVAMEAALRAYDGKAMINSVNGKKESMEAVFPLVRKYGGLVVALTLDENGIPPTAEGRLEVARRILSAASEYGIDKKDLIFDPLALTVSADESAAAETLRAVRLIKDELGCHTSLGVSNVSFGLPRRDLINGTFFALALANGLSAAIMNPYSEQMMTAYRAFNALSGHDPSCADYIEYATSLPDTQTAGVVPVSSPKDTLQGNSELSDAIVKGLKDRASVLTRALIEDAHREPLDLIQNEIVPALNTVGEGYEKHTVFLPGLLMSAEAAKAAFEQIKAHAPTDARGTRCLRIVIATVKGDIHDIGKNIVRMMLENYGFDVTDLGKDVSPEDIVCAAREKHAHVVGLSALMTTTVPAMEQTIKLLREQYPECRTLVGGAVLNPEYAGRIGADKYARDAMEAVRYAEQLEAGILTKE